MADRVELASARFTAGEVESAALAAGIPPELLQALLAKLSEAREGKKGANGGADGHLDAGPSVAICSKAEDEGMEGGLSEDAAVLTQGQPANIWLLAHANPGDNHPLLALCRGLQEAGHRVKVFGMGVMTRLYRDCGVDFEAYDGPFARHPGNTEARGFVSKQAEEAGFQGASKDDDYLLDVVLLWTETLNRKRIEYCTTRRSLDKALSLTEREDSTFRSFRDRGLFIDKLQDRRRECLAYLAKQAGRSVESYELVVGKRREAFRRLVKRKAAEQARHPIDVFLALHVRLGAVVQAELARAGANPEAHVEITVSQLNAFYAWQHLDDAFLEQAWRRWWHHPAVISEEVVEVGEMMPKLGPLCLMNLLFSFAVAEPEDRPHMLVYHFKLASTALELRARHRMNTMIWWPQMPPATDAERMEKLLECFDSEDGAKVVPRPLHDRRQLDLIDIYVGPRQLVTLSPLTMEGRDFNGDADLQKCLTSCCTGHLVWDPQPRDEKSAAPFSGTPEERSSLEDFLARGGGEAPVYVGFGSNEHPLGAPALAKLVVQFLKASGARGIFAAGRSRVTFEQWRRAILEEFPEDAEEVAKERMIYVGAAPHEWLLSQCACVVHHGGAGTCHAALRAGVPSIVVPLLADQPRNAEWLSSLGCGVTATSLAELSAGELADSLKVVLASRKLKDRARELAAAVCAERGTAAAVEMVERCLRKPEEESAPRRQSFPWPRALYAAHSSGGRRLPEPELELDGEVMLRRGKKVGWIQAGSFTVEGRAYSFQAIVPSLKNMFHFNVSEDGKTLSMSDGAQLRYTRDASHSKSDGSGLPCIIAVLIVLLALWMYRTPAAPDIAG